MAEDWYERLLIMPGWIGGITATSRTSCCTRPRSGVADRVPQLADALGLGGALDGLPVEAAESVVSLDVA